MSITVIGTARDGALLGEDAQGNLHRGIEIRVGFDELERTVVADGDTFRVTYSHSGHVVANETTLKEPEAYEPEKQYRDVFVERDGKEVQEKREVFAKVIQWEAL